MLIDLHCHSTASDGLDPPDQVIRHARQRGVDVLALTDHDTVAGVEEAAAALPAGLTLVAGAELSCTDADRGSVHLLGYLFDPGEPVLAAERERIRTDRTRRGEAMAERLVELGVPVSFADVRRIAGDGVIGRPHVARALVESGVVRTVEDAFGPEWIGVGGRAYVPKYALAPERVIELVRNAGGVTVLAHPAARPRRVDGLSHWIARLAAAGLHGVEVDHPEHDEAQRTWLREIATDLGLIVTGGSDYHETGAGHQVGHESTDPQAYERLVSQAYGTVPVVR